MAEGGATDEARLTHTFRLCAARPPDSAELTELRSLLATARIVLNLDEFITRE